MPSNGELFNVDWDREFAPDEGLAALCSPSTTWKPVRPEKTSLESQKPTAEKQAGEIRRGFACPCCQVGIVPIGGVICTVCAAKLEEAES